MASEHHICHLCKEIDVSNVAAVWCADCETFLCKDCKRHHNRSKASKGHQTIVLDDYKKLPSFIIDIRNRCEKHDEKYDFFCKFHVAPCCVKCIKDKHKVCRDLNPLVEVLRDIKTSAKVSILDKELSILQENFEIIGKHLNSKIANLQENKTESLNEIRNMRVSINNHLDEIEKKIVDDLSVEFNKIKQKSDNLNSDIEYKMKVIKNLQNDLSTMTMYATDLQMYVGLQYLEKSSSEEVGFLNELQENDQLNELCFGIEFSSDLKCLTNSIRTFGTVVIHSSPGTLKLKSSSEYQVHLLVPPMLTIDSIKPKLKTTFKIPNIFRDIEIYGCQVLHDSRILILDKISRCMLLFSKDGKYTESVMHFDDTPTDVCFIKDFLIAVTITKQNKILLIDLSQKSNTKTITVPDSCFGIDSNGETLIVKLPGRRLLTLDLDGNILSEVNVPGLYSLHTAQYENNIFCTDRNFNRISCNTNKGALLWTYKHEDICEPYGITVDKHGFIYVACKGNDKIVAVSKDGKSSRTILSKDNGIVQPVAINIDKTSSTLLVTNRSNGNAFVFEI
ncbi:uncharacterized protein LOC127711760 [Mytilus californianus]|uniref:uncharacterized protein LOC127711760 n=1 Tax=Mytilus californianus TaxID=6549 RepID=UPI0022453805|nr:uncharacterized protein LOC127711760 [Mytilus californianus]